METRANTLPASCDTVLVLPARVDTRALSPPSSLDDDGSHLAVASQRWAFVFDIWAISISDDEKFLAVGTSYEDFGGVTNSGTVMVFRAAGDWSDDMGISEELSGEDPLTEAEPDAAEPDAAEPDGAEPAME